MPLLLLAIPAAVALQYRLAKQPKRWPGLVLPALCFLLSIAFCAWLAVFSHVEPGYTLRTADGLYHHFDTLQDAERFAEKQNDALLQFSQADPAPTGAFTARLALIFVGLNLVTALLLALFWRARRRPKPRFAPKKPPR